jgi:hypothetical protein
MKISPRCQWDRSRCLKGRTVKGHFINQPNLTNTLEMFSKLISAIVLALPLVAFAGTIHIRGGGGEHRDSGAGGSCNQGSQQCCNQLQDVSLPFDEPQHDILTTAPGSRRPCSRHRISCQHFPPDLGRPSWR